MNEDETTLPAVVGENDNDVLDTGAVEAQRDQSANLYLRRMIDRNFLEYASYVIKDRAIPDVDDGLKPVQRRILWSLMRLDDGKFHKVANVIGHTMQFHPHGDASIGDALVVLANKEYFIDRQGNFGNIYTGDGASAPRYIECRLSPLAKEVLFNNPITELVDSYDGRNQEPVVLPVKIPALLMLGTEGIAVGMSTRILPHNFNELLKAQIAVLRGEDFELYPDFLQGGLMDVREYAKGTGKITLRAKIDIDGRKLVIREIPATTTTESLIASIERAVEKGKIKIAAVNDYTAEKVEIEIVPTRGHDPEKALQALYTYTDCAKSISVNMMVICENRPCEMNVDQVIRRNTDKLLTYLKLELELELARLGEMFHAKTLAQIFIENRIYKKIEECVTSDAVQLAVLEGLAPFRDLLRRDITPEDIEKLLALQIRRISLFDIRKNQEEIADILAQMAEAEKNLKHLNAYAIKYLEALLAKYGAQFPRRTEIENLEKIDRREAALNNIKVGWDRKNGYIGTGIKSDDNILVNEFDKLQCMERNGSYKIIPIPEKMFIGKLYDFRKYDPTVEFGVIYRENKTGKFYGKRCKIDKFITERVYNLCPANCRLDLFTPRPDAIYEAFIADKRNKEKQELNVMMLAVRSAKARGLLLFNGKSLEKLTWQRYLEADELALLLSGIQPAADDGEDHDESEDIEVEAVEVVEETVVTENVEVVEETVDSVTVEFSENTETVPEASDFILEEARELARPPRKRAPRPAPAPSNAPVTAAPAATPEAESTSTPPERDPLDDLGIVQPEFGF